MSVNWAQPFLSLFSKHDKTHSKFKSSLSFPFSAQKFTCFVENSLFQERRKNYERRVGKCIHSFHGWKLAWILMVLLCKLSVWAMKKLNYVRAQTWMMWRVIITIMFLESWWKGWSIAIALSSNFKLFSAQVCMWSESWDNIFRASSHYKVFLCRLYGSTKNVFI